ncbi:MAG: hypothetical protein K2V38_24630, partial [Gemmataceae bacterium]|nr:hypothetical protein [Gemmataceae bacterium]
MSKSERVTSAQELAVVRLVNECRELGDDAVAWQAHMLAGLRRLTDAGVVTTGPYPTPGRYAVTSVELGWPSDAVRTRWQEWTLDPRNMEQHPATWEFLQTPGATLARTRRQLVPDREWAQSEFANDRLRPDGMDDGMMARVTVAGVVYTSVVMRPAGRRLYAPRDARLLEQLHAQLAPHLGRALLVTTQ